MIRIEEDAQALLLKRLHALPQSVAGLRVVLTGNTCHGLHGALQWSALLRPDDQWEDNQGVRILAAPAFWPYLDNATISLGNNGEQSGLWLTLQPTACDCDNRDCAVPHPQA
jgi:Fe-S cluster assembly iron-binding protein IscA